VTGKQHGSGRFRPGRPLPGRAPGRAGRPGCGAVR
jgi:hypothetical protein